MNVKRNISKAMCEEINFMSNILMTQISAYNLLYASNALSSIKENVFLRFELDNP